jgi:hypothetical protein
MHHLLVHFHFSMMGKCEPLLFLFYFIIIIITTPNMLTAELIDHFLVLVYAKVVPGSELCC